jgi:5'-methylthioadenosine phosphorylase
MTGQRKPVVGILGGSGVYELDGLADARWEKVESPFGAPSDELLFGELNGVSQARRCHRPALAQRLRLAA